MSQMDSFKTHPIQLDQIKVLELSLVANLENQQEEPPTEGEFNLYHGHSKFNSEERKVAVKIGLKIDSTNTNSPFYLNIEILGIFSVSEDFDDRHVDSWAKKNGPLVIYPYLREHAYSLTSRAGFEGIILPLFEVPAFKIEK